MATAGTHKTKWFRKRLTLLLILTLFFSWVLFWVFNNLSFPVSAGQPLVAVSADTTFLTEPLDKNGDVDYVAAAELVCPPPIPAEENALAYYMQVLGFDSENPERMQAMGFITKMDQKHYQDFESWMNSQGRDYYGSGYDTHLKYAHIVPWNQEQLPVLADWLKSQEQLLPLIIKGSQQDRRHWQLRKLSNLWESDPMPWHWERLISFIQLAAMNLLGQGKIEESIDLLEAGFIVAEDCTCNPSSQCMFKREAAFLKIHASFCSVISYPAISSEQLERVSTLLREHPLLTDEKTTQSLDLLIALDFIVHCGRNGQSGAEALELSTDNNPQEAGIPARLRLAGMEIVQWSAVMKHLVSLHNARVAGASATQDQQQLLQEHLSQNANVDQSINWKDCFFLRRWATEQEVRYTGNYYLPLAWKNRDWSISSNVLQIGIAVRKFHLKERRLPEGLNELSPVFLDSIPENTQPLTYVKIDGGFAIARMDDFSFVEDSRFPKAWRWDPAPFEFANFNPFPWDEQISDFPLESDSASEN